MREVREAQRQEQQQRANEALQMAEELRLQGNDAFRQGQLPGNAASKQHLLQAVELYAEAIRTLSKCLETGLAMVPEQAAELAKQRGLLRSQCCASGALKPAVAGSCGTGQGGLGGRPGVPEVAASPRQSTAGPWRLDRGSDNGRPGPAVSEKPACQRARGLYCGTLEAGRADLREAAGEGLVCVEARAEESRTGRLREAACWMVGIPGQHFRDQARTMGGPGLQGGHHED